MIYKYINELKVTFSKIKHYLWERLCDMMVRIDVTVNHGFVEVLLLKLLDNNYKVWYSTCYKYCLWTCDNFERFEE